MISKYECVFTSVCFLHSCKYVYCLMHLYLLFGIKIRRQIKIGHVYWTLSLISSFSDIYSPLDSFSLTNAIHAYYIVGVYFSSFISILSKDISFLLFFPFFLSSVFFIYLFQFTSFFIIFLLVSAFISFLIFSFSYWFILFSFRYLFLIFLFYFFSSLFPISFFLFILFSCFSFLLIIPHFLFPSSSFIYSFIFA